MRYIIIAIYLVLSVFICSALEVNKPKYEVHSHPLDAITEAVEVLNNSDSEPIDRVLAVMVYANAKTNIAPDSIYAQIAFIDKHIECEKDEIASGLLTLYRAEILSDLYQRKSYSQEIIGIDDNSSDVNSWSASKIKEDIIRNVNDALNLITSRSNLSIKDYDDILEFDNLSAVFYPYLHDFAYSLSLDLMANLNEPQLYNDLKEQFFSRVREGSSEWIVWQPTDIDNYKELYEIYPNGIVGAYLLLNLSTNHSDKITNIHLIEKYLSSQSANALTANLKLTLEFLKRPYLAVSNPSVCNTGVATKFALNGGFISDLDIKIEKFNAEKRSYEEYDALSYKYNIEDEVFTDTISYTFRDQGEYRLSIFLNCQDEQYGTINLDATPIIPVTITSDNNNGLFIVDYDNGQPKSNHNVYLCNNENHKKFHLGKTDEKGFILVDSLPNNFYNYNYKLIVENGKDKYMFDSNFRNFQLKDGRIYCDLQLSRPVYKPGETVEWCILSKKVNRKTSEVTFLSNVEFDVYLKNFNGEKVDSTTVIIDNYGRSYGEFIIPEGDLTGRYLISWEIAEQSFFQHVEVSEYKMPTFEIVDQNVRMNNSESRTAVTVSGRALSFSGMPVANAHVDIDLLPYSFWRSYSDYGSLKSDTTTTDENGNYTLDIDVTSLKKLGYNNYLNAFTKVTSQTTDVATKSTSFILDKPYTLQVLDDNINIDDSKINVVATDINGGHINLDLNWKLCKNNQLVLSGTGTIDSTFMHIDFANVKADIYRLILSPVDTLICDSIELNVDLYSIKNNDFPSSRQLFLTTTEITSDADGQFSFNVGVSDCRMLYYMMVSKNKTYRHEIIKVKDGFNKVEQALQPEEDNAEIVIFVVNDGTVETRQLNVIRPVKNKLNLKVESWRDKITPGADELWTLTLKDANSRGRAGALVTRMYNHALDIIANEYSGFKGLNNRTYFDIDIRYKSNYPDKSYWDYRGYNNWFTVSAPRFILQLNSYYRVFSYSTRNMAAGSPKYYSIATNDVAVTDLLYVADEGVAEEAVEGEEDTQSGNDTNSIDYRSDYTPLAFWMPNLCFNDNGEAEISFTVPNANATWIFNAWAWDDDLNYASVTKNIIANKPIMVEPNLPRFLRTGDNATVLANIYNNTDSIQQVTTIVEIFNPEDDSIISSKRQADTIGANSSAVISIDITANVSQTFVGYRIKTSNGIFTDGEQSQILIAPSGTTVIESDNFYLTNENPSYTKTLQADSTSIRTLTYCQNPVWDVVKILPRLYTYRPNSSLNAVNALYGALTTQGLASKNPDISKTLELLSVNDSDSSLVSDLYKNEDLKISLLHQTPWMQDASTENLRLQRLLLTFDKDETQNIIKNSIKTLTDLQNSDGGFKWGRWSDESSTWITLRILCTLGLLNESGMTYDNTDLSKIVNDAFKFVDNNALKTGELYTYMYSLYPNRKPSTIKGKQAIAKTVQSILKNWKGYNTEVKARSALILNSFNYKNVALEIVNSIRQFKVESPQVGIFFPSVNSVDAYSSILYAFSKISPDINEVDKMRQWLIIKTQVTDDLGSYNPTQLISAILSTGSKWSQISTHNDILINGNPLEIETYESMTGTVTQRLQQSDTETTIEINRPSVSIISYGSVINVEQQPMTEVEPYAGSDISITKRVLVNRNGEWVETTTPLMGEQIKVQLIITTQRDLEYVTIVDERPASYEPLPSEQISGYKYYSGIHFYKETGNQNTMMFVNYLPKGRYVITSDMTSMFAGTFSSGIATIQSQYAPEITAHSGGCQINVTKCQ